MILFKDGQCAVVGSSNEILDEVCTILKIFVDETTKHNAEDGKRMKAIIVDQIQNDFDTDRLDLFVGGDNKYAS